MNHRSPLVRTLLPAVVLAWSGCDGLDDDDDCTGGACLPAADLEWARWPMPTNPASNLPNPASYDTSTPGVVLDRVTGLAWQRDVQTNTNPTIMGGCNAAQIGGPGCFSLTQARAYCASLSLAGGGWRLPTLIEALSIRTVDLQTFPVRYLPRTPRAMFTTTGLVSTFAQGRTGTGQSYVEEQFSPDFVPLGDANDDPLTRDAAGSGFPRCVRSTRAPASSEHYRDNGDGTVLDVQTRLTWQKAPGPSPLPPPSTEPTASPRDAWPNARSYCASLSLAGGGWRLPTLRELFTLFDLRRYRAGQNAIDPQAFPATPEARFWSSESINIPYDSRNERPWTLNFGQAITRSRDSNLVEASFLEGHPEFPHRVRCVR